LIVRDAIDSITERGDNIVCRLCGARTENDGDNLAEMPHAPDCPYPVIMRALDVLYAVARNAPVKYCPRCQQFLPESDFAPERNPAKGRLHGYCRDCAREVGNESRRRARQRPEVREAERAYQRVHYPLVREKKLARERECKRERAEREGREFRPRRFYTSDERQHIQALHEQGYKAREIAQMIGAPEGTIYHMLRRLRGAKGG
jgi:hypothetical protein